MKILNNMVFKSKEEIKKGLIEKGITFSENATYKELLELDKEPENLESTDSTSKIQSEEILNNSTSDKKVVVKDTIEISKADWEKVQQQLQTLYAVADKGRLSNYENKIQNKKPFTVKLSVYQGQIIIGWAIKKDELIKDVRTGVTIGERQEIEVKLLDKEGKENLINLDGYISFSNARYNERIDCEVINKKEDWQGNMSFDIKLPDGRLITLDSRFVN